MLDMPHLPPLQNADVQIFTQPATTAFTNWHVYNKPRGASMLYMFALDPGSGGGGGVPQSTGGAVGGAGASGAQAVVMIPAIFLPDILYVQIGLGGTGGAGVTTGNSAGNGTAPTIHTIVSIEPQTAAVPNVFVLQAGSAFPNGGNGATSGTNGTGSAVAGAAATIANCCLAGLGFYSFTVGQTGVNGGTSNTFPTTGLTVTGGSGSGFTQPANVQDFYLSIANQGTAVITGGNYISWKPFYAIAAPVGGRSNSLSGPSDKAPFGCGGIGGASNTGGTGLNGGFGGDGLVIIAAW